MHYGKTIGQLGSLNVIMCNHCDFPHLDPLPTMTDLNQLYTNEYYESVKPDYISKDINEGHYWEIAFAQRLRILSKHTKSKKLLDIGCGTGRFIKYASSQGWDCTGIEPSKLACEVAYADNLSVICDTFENYCLNNSELYDVVHLKNVLEHILNPDEYLQLCHQLLKPGGILYIEVPNDFDIIQKACNYFLKCKQTWISKEHISYFNFRSLNKLLVKKHFSILERDTTFPMYLFPLLGYNFIDKPDIGSKCHKLRMNFELFAYRFKLGHLLQILYKFLAYLGMGRTVIFYAKKI
jgi:2-polyprenyl-3-methyl-5-hydroxy-6-metoxy-1,4-benzoquinol methylase